jgi:hypothetical protein
MRQRRQLSNTLKLIKNRKYGGTILWRQKPAHALSPATLMHSAKQQHQRFCHRQTKGMCGFFDTGIDDSAGVKLAEIRTSY